MTDIRWYQTLALWKSIVFMEGNYKRAVSRHHRRPVPAALRRGRDRARGARGGSLRMAADGTLRGLLVDWGGVLTTDVFASFETFCRREGLDPLLVRDMFRDDPEARHTLFSLETGELTEPEFELEFTRILGLRDDRAPGLIDRMFGGMKRGHRDVRRRALRQGSRASGRGCSPTPGASTATTAAASRSSSTRS